MRGDFPLDRRTRMSDIGYHPSLNTLCEAAALTRCGMQCLPVPLTAPGEPAWDQLRGREKRAHQRFVWRQHVDLAARVAAVPPGVPILVREFSTLPLAMLAGRFRPVRERLFLLVNHNLQWAVRSAAERLGLIGLERAGFRFLFFETLDLAPLKRWRFHPGRHGTLPLPVTGARSGPPTRPAGPLRVGLAGQYRLEKGMDQALASLLAEREIPCRLRIGIPNPDAFLRSSPLADRRADYDLVDTGDPAVFRRFLEDCDVIVLNYEESAYAYRPSGLMADAAACGVPVVIPDLPVQREQMRYPGPVGEVKAAGESLWAAVSRAAAGARTGRYDFAAYARARSREALAGILDARVAEARSR